PPTWCTNGIFHNAIHPEYDRGKSSLGNNIALITVVRKLTPSKAVQRISLASKLIDNSHHANILQQIPILYLEDYYNSSVLLNVRLKSGSPEECNFQHNTGRPLMQCNDKSGDCALVGLSSEIKSVPDGGMVESFTIVEAYLPWIQNALNNTIK
uniref:Peptidase S1 domain-containing protein n=1 Tax=Romanomermis culicivorax TaxID=13658 RepID=A0A915LA64_ROMCU